MKGRYELDTSNPEIQAELAAEKLRYEALKEAHFEMGPVKSLTFDDYELFNELLSTHIMRVEDATNAGDFLTERVLAEMRDRAIGVRVRLSQLLGNASVKIVNEEADDES